MAKTGENHLLTSRTLLESAVARPKHLYAYDAVEDIIVLGVRLIEGIGRNHCFEQGNKRTAFHAGLTFMELNDVYLNIPDTEATAKLVTEFITGDIPANELIDLLRQHRI